MQSKRFGNRFILRLDRGDEIIDSVKRFCLENDVRLASVSGIGATNNVTIGLFDVETKKYSSREFVGNYEICPLYGNISTMNGEIYLHLHANISDAKQNSFGGHLNSGLISATCEIIVDIIDGEIDRVFDEEIGLNLIRFPEK